MDHLAKRIFFKRGSHRYPRKSRRISHDRDQIKKIARTSRRSHFTIYRPRYIKYNFYTSRHRDPPLSQEKYCSFRITLLCTTRWMTMPTTQNKMAWNQLVFEEVVTTTWTIAGLTRSACGPVALSCRRARTNRASTLHLTRCSGSCRTRVTREPQ